MTFADPGCIVFFKDRFSLWRGIMRKLSKLVSTIDNISEMCGRIFSFFIISLVALSIFEVFTRRFLGRPTIWSDEILSYCFCATIMLTIGYTLRHKAHVKIDIFPKRLSEKGQATLEIITFIVFIGFFTIVFLWKSIHFAGISWIRLERSPSAFNFFVFPAKTLLPVGAFLLLIQLLADFLRNIVFVIKGERL